MKPFNFCVVLLSSFLALSNNAFARADGDAPPRCLRASYERCQAENKEALARYQAARKEKERNMDILKSQISQVQSHMSDIDIKLNNNHLAMQSVLREIGFLSKSDDANSIIYPVSVSAQHLFALPEAELDWLESQPKSRLDRLEKIRINTDREALDLNSVKASLLKNINEYSENLQAEISQYGGFAYQESVHDSMCRGGCRAQFCPME